MRIKNTNFLLTAYSLTRSLSIILLCVFSVTMLLDSFPNLNNGEINFELSETSSHEAEQPVSDSESQKEENKEGSEEFILIKKSSGATAYYIKIHNPVTHKLLFESRISELLTPPPRLS